MRVILQADRKPKQNHKDDNLPILPQELFQLVKDVGLMLDQENIHPPVMRCRRDWFIFFVMENRFEKIMERLNSGESKAIFGNISCIVIIGLTTSGRRAWQEEEKTRKDNSIVMIHQE